MATAILLNWARPHNIPVIASNLRKTPSIIKQVLVWDNSGELPESNLYDLISSGRNEFTLGRYLAARHAEHDELYFQDDDVLVENIAWLYHYWKKQPTKIVAGLADTPELKHFEFEAHRKPWLQLGWGSFHRKEWLEVTDEYVARHGEDEILRRKWDRIYTTLHGNHAPVRGKFTRLKNPNGKYSDSDSSALWLKPDHMELTSQAVSRAMAIRKELQASL